MKKVYFLLLLFILFSSNSFADSPPALPPSNIPYGPSWATKKFQSPSMAMIYNRLEDITNGTVPLSADWHIGTYKIISDKASGVAGQLNLYTKNSTDLYTTGWEGSDASNYFYRLKFPDEKASEPSILSVTNVGETGDGLDASTAYLQPAGYIPISGGVMPYVALTTGTDNAVESPERNWIVTLNNTTTDGAAVSYTLPIASSGKVRDYKNYTSKTGAITVLPSSETQYIDLDGTAMAAGQGISSSGAAGDGIQFLGVDSTHWLARNKVGTWAPGPTPTPTPTPPSFVGQATYAAYNSGSEVDISYAPTEGNTIIVTGGNTNDNWAMASVTDNQSSTYTAYNSNSVYILNNCPSGITTIKVTGNAGYNWSISIVEYSNVASTSPLDSNSSINSITYTSDPWATPSINTTFANDVLIAIVNVGYTYSTHSVASTGFTSRSNAHNDSYHQIAILEKQITSTGSYSASGDDDGTYAGDKSAQIFALKGK